MDNISHYLKGVDIIAFQHNGIFYALKKKADGIWNAYIGNICIQMKFVPAFGYCKNPNAPYECEIYYKNALIGRQTGTSPGLAYFNVHSDAM